MLQHGWVQAVDCTSFQAKMSSQNSGYDCWVVVTGVRIQAETNMYIVCNLFGTERFDIYFCVVSQSDWHEFLASGAGGDWPAKLFCVSGSTWGLLPRIHHRR